ncbi:MAG TPA: GAF domain-containing SpoIIE family protein phosphatase [Actinomycetota bacterium]|nr:GAF domain-containing SpoIIE family protein phosphatase [Actinomycetota bacterium]
MEREDDTTDPAVSLGRRMLEAERRAREVAEHALAEAENAQAVAEKAQAEAEAAREEAVRAREEAERARGLETLARERLQVLVEAGVAMAASLETRSALAAATAAAARRVCDYGVAFVVDREGRVEAAVGAHRDPARFGMVERMASAHLPDPEDPDSIVAEVLKTGEPALIPNLSPDQLERMLAPGEQLELARSLGLASLIVAPLAARGRTLGVLVLVRADPSTPFVEEDLSLAGMLAARTGLAVDNARLYAEREYVAETLRRSLLPPELPSIDGLEIAARYLPAAAEGTRVGGDFYDVFEAASERWIAVIGDVVGKGAEAAAMMGLARYTIRTAAMSEGRPSALLETLNQAVLQQTDEERFCTACCVRLRPSRNQTRATVSAGGHPLPLVLRSDGSIEVVGSPGTIVGVFEDPVLIDDAVDLGTGDTLVLYTDGVTDERRDDDEFGEARLHEALSELTGASAQGIADGVVEAVVGFRAGQPKDDIAILAIQVVG